MNFGVQTFTVRRLQKKDKAKAYRTLRELGVSNLEIARISFDRKNADEVKAVCDGLGIEVSAIQVKPKYVFRSPQKIIEFCKTVGCKNVVISMLPFKCILGKETEFYSFVDSLDELAEVYAEAGLTLAYHHHNWEYVRLSNQKSRMEELLARTERIKFVHDTYWTARCGISPVAQIKQFGGRLLGIHLRDLGFKKRGIEVISRDRAVGDGVIDFEAVLSAAEEVGCSYYVVEQKTDRPYCELEKSLNYLRKITSERKIKE